MAVKTARRAKSPKALEKEVDRLEREVYRAKERLDKARHRLPEVEIPDYVLRGADGKPLLLSKAFGAKDDLVVVFNMGVRCPMCTTWADGFSGVAHHLEDRAALLVVSKDPVKVQRPFAKKRGWRFPMASTEGSTFYKDTGFEDAEARPWPGIATFHRTADGRIFRIAKTSFGPGDDFSPVFGVLPLLFQGQNGWWPKLDYRRPRR